MYLVKLAMYKGLAQGGSGEYSFDAINFSNNLKLVSVKQIFCVVVFGIV